MRLKLWAPCLSMGAGAALLLIGWLFGAAQSGTPRQGPAAAATMQRNTGRLIVGVKPTMPILPSEVAALGKQLGAKIMNVAPDGAFMLVMPRKGTTPTKIRSRGGERVVSVDREIYMGTAESNRSLLLVVPIRRLPGDVIAMPKAKAKKPPPKAPPIRKSGGLH